MVEPIINPEAKGTMAEIAYKSPSYVLVGYVDDDDTQPNAIIIREYDTLFDALNNREMDTEKAQTELRKINCQNNPEYAGVVVASRICKVETLEVF